MKLIEALKLPSDPQPLKIVVYVALALVILIVPLTGKLRTYNKKKNKFFMNWRGYLVLASFVVVMWMLYH